MEAPSSRGRPRAYWGLGNLGAFAEAEGRVTTFADDMLE